MRKPSQTVKAVAKSFHVAHQTSLSCILTSALPCVLLETPHDQILSEKIQEGLRMLQNWFQQLFQVSDVNFSCFHIYFGEKKQRILKTYLLKTTSLLLPSPLSQTITTKQRKDNL